MQELKTQTFKSPEELTDFINKNGIGSANIVSICSSGKILNDTYSITEWTLFYLYY